MLKRYKDKKVDRDWLNTNFPCMMACPAHTNAGRYVGLIGEGRFEDGKVIPMKVSVGNVVLFQWGDQIKIDGEEYHVVSESNIIAIVK